MTIIFSEKYIEHVQTPDHPESPKRLIAIRDTLRSFDLWENVLEPRYARDDEIENIYAKDYLEFLSTAGECMLTLDTVMHPETLGIAKLAVGGAIMAGEKAWEEGKPAIALVRPPGHHSGPAYGMGFCYLNNIAIAAEQMIQRAKKIAIVDIDVHHGNGTQDIFYDRCDVLYVSTRQKYIFPGTGHIKETGEGEGKGYTVNIPMESDAGDESFKYAHEKIVLPLLEEYKPGMLMVSIGVDAHYRDPFASLALSSNGYAREIKDLIAFARRECSGRIAFYLEGGYDLEALSEVVAYTVGLFTGNDLPLKYTDIRDVNCIEKTSIENIINFQKSYWKL